MRKSVTISDQPPEEIPIPDFDPDPIQIHEGAKPHTTKGVPIPPPRSLPPMSPVTYMTPSRVLSSIHKGDDVDRIEKKVQKSIESYTF